MVRESRRANPEGYGQVCRYNTAVEASGSRTPRHTANHRIPRAEIQRIIDLVVCSLSL